MSSDGGEKIRARLAACRSTVYPVPYRPYLLRSDTATVTGVFAGVTIGNRKPLKNRRNGLQLASPNLYNALIDNGLTRQYRFHRRMAYLLPKKAPEIIATKLDMQAFNCRSVHTEGHQPETRPSTFRVSRRTFFPVDSVLISFRSIPGSRFLYRHPQPFASPPVRTKPCLKSSFD